ncbi:hypothetical protein P152DRAFT_187223 [Eremomyces bilateralis CBS 781.70]|uniref:Uncharacterized protein n=1 Tax=Eremomyces bilateralis CBS 781.70 TaxID=1392243 RepID=A0A6G1GBV6_9PEZI|nr:uncharacterized protein P152DRAFT_187223 [Eremomyces bilateralis CBS 781.70]KAF1815504.1 hypothetical protein P152DRAFT_187223 [Eremomyces bilateralis CBS 781.70]
MEVDVDHDAEAGATGDVEVTGRNGVVLVKDSQPDALVSPSSQEKKKKKKMKKSAARIVEDSDVAIPSSIPNNTAEQDHAPEQSSSPIQIRPSEDLRADDYDVPISEDEDEEEAPPKPTGKLSRPSFFTPRKPGNNVLGIRPNGSLETSGPMSASKALDAAREQRQVGSATSSKSAQLPRKPSPPVASKLMGNMRPFLTQNNLVPQRGESSRSAQSKSLTPRATSASRRAKSVATKTVPAAGGNKWDDHEEETLLKALRNSMTLKYIENSNLLPGRSYESIKGKARLFKSNGRINDAPKSSPPASSLNVMRPPPKRSGLRNSDSAAISVSASPRNATDKVTRLGQRPSSKSATYITADDDASEVSDPEVPLVRSNPPSDLSRAPRSSSISSTSKRPIAPAFRAPSSRRGSSGGDSISIDDRRSSIRDSDSVISGRFLSPKASGEEGSEEQEESKTSTSASIDENTGNKESSYHVDEDDNDTTDDEPTIEVERLKNSTPGTGKITRAAKVAEKTKTRAGERNVAETDESDADEETDTREAASSSGEERESEEDKEETQAVEAEETTDEAEEEVIEKQSVEAEETTDDEEEEDESEATSVEEKETTDDEEDDEEEAEAALAPVPLVPRERSEVSSDEPERSPAQLKVHPKKKNLPSSLPTAKKTESSPAQSVHPPAWQAVNKIASQPSDQDMLDADDEIPSSPPILDTEPVASAKKEEPPKPKPAPPATYKSRFPSFRHALNPSQSQGRSTLSSPLPGQAKRSPTATKPPTPKNPKTSALTSPTTKPLSSATKKPPTKKPPRASPSSDASSTSSEDDDDDDDDDDGPDMDAVNSMRTPREKGQGRLHQLANVVKRADKEKSERLSFGRW